MIDLIICTRLAKDVKSKGKDENKFNYLYHAYLKIADHLVARRKTMADQIKDLQNITARYFVSCLTSPDTFGIENDIVEITEQSAGMFPGAGGDIEQ